MFKKGDRIGTTQTTVPVAEHAQSSFLISARKTLPIAALELKKNADV